MRFHIFAVSIFAAGMAHAEDFAIRADISHATIYGGGAEVARTAQVTVPAGSHRILIPMPPYMSGTDRIAVTLPDGRVLGPVRFDYAPGFDDGQFDTDAEAGLRAGILDLERQIEEAEAAVSEIDTDLGVLAVQQRFLESYATAGGPEGTAPADLGEVLRALGTQMQNVADQILHLRRSHSSAEEEIAQMRDMLARQEAELAALHPLGADSIALVVPLEATGMIDLDLTIHQFVPGPSWAMDYAAQLSTVEGTLTLDRTARIGFPLPDMWENVALSLSGEDWGQALAMSDVWPSLARIEEHRPPEVFQDRLVAGLAGSPGAPPAVEPAIVAETASLTGYGLSYSAEVPTAQTLSQGEETAVPFAPLTLDAEITIEANPRSDDTAFLIAQAENTTGEPLIAGNLSVYRDGAFLADEYLDIIPPGGEVDLPFGSVDHLQLFWRDLSRNEGDEGFFNRSNVQRQIVEFGVTNVSDQPEDVRILYAVPYSEQDDLELDLTLSIPASVEDLDGRRGIYAWDLTVGPGETRTIRMDAQMSWPDGYDLFWRP